MMKFSSTLLFLSMFIGTQCWIKPMNKRLLNGLFQRKPIGQIPCQQNPQCW